MKRKHRTPKGVKHVKGFRDREDRAKPQHRTRRGNFFTELKKMLRDPR